MHSSTKIRLELNEWEMVRCSFYYFVFCIRNIDVANIRRRRDFCWTLNLCNWACAMTHGLGTHLNQRYKYHKKWWRTTRVTVCVIFPVSLFRKHFHCNYMNHSGMKKRNKRENNGKLKYFIKLFILLLIVVRGVKRIIHLSIFTFWTMVLVRKW